MATQTDTLTLTTAGPDVTISKTEIFDVDFAKWLLERKEGDISKQERLAVRRILKARVDGNKHIVSYKLGKGGEAKVDKIGRLNGQGACLQLLERDCRAALAQKYYWDVDMRNAQPTLLQQYAEERGWVCAALKRYNENRDDLIAEMMEELAIERWEAKQRMTALCFGGTPEGLTSFFAHELHPELRKLMENILKENQHKYAWIARRPNAYGRMMAYVLQTEERKVLLAMDTALARLGRSMDVYIHDGGLVRKKEGEQRLPEEVLRRVEREVEETTGYKISLAVKEMKTTFEREEDNGVEYVPSNVIVDDAYAATTLAKLLEGKLVMDGCVWVFDDTTGIWTADDTVLNRKMAIDFRENLVFRQQKDGRVCVYNYSGDVAHQDRLRRALPAVLPDRRGYFKDRIESSVGKLLFSNGFYDFKTQTFTEGFDPEIVFFGSVPRPFPTTRNEQAIDYVRKVFFRDPFANPAVGDALLHWVSRGIAGHYEAKKVIVPYGPANSTKGTLCKHLDTTFGPGLIGSFNGDSLLMRTGDVEATKSLSWVKQIYNKRIAYSNEITIDAAKPKPINGNLLKTLSGGGDEITLRTNHRDEEKVTNTSMEFIFVNDFPNISPVDASIRDRLVTIPYSHSFVDEPKLPNEKKRDHTISKTLKNDEYRDATVLLILDTLKQWDGEPYVLPEECNMLKNDLAPMSDVREILSEEFDLTGNPEDWVATDDLVAYLRSRKIDGSDRKLGDRLAQIGLESGVKRDGRRTVRVRIGIRRAE